MKIIKIVRNTTIVAVFCVATALISGCGGVSEAEMAQLNNLRSEVNSLQATANSLKDQRASLEKDIAAKQEKLAECNKEKEETKANLDKMSSK
jgi:septal ring factor EnvC (AmiA/AmiB activator)